MKRNIILIILILLFIVSVSFSGLGFYYDKNNSNNDEDTVIDNNVNEDNNDNTIDNKKDEDKDNTIPNEVVDNNDNNLNDEPDNEINNEDDDNDYYYETIKINNKEIKYNQAYIWDYDTIYDKYFKMNEKGFEGEEIPFIKLQNKKIYWNIDNKWVKDKYIDENIKYFSSYADCYSGGYIFAVTESNKIYYSYFADIIDSANDSECRLDDDDFNDGAKLLYNNYKYYETSAKGKINNISRKAFIFECEVLVNLFYFNIDGEILVLSIDDNASLLPINTYMKEHKISITTFGGYSCAGDSEEPSFSVNIDGTIDNVKDENGNLIKVKYYIYLTNNNLVIDKNNNLYFIDLNAKTQKSISKVTNFKQTGNTINFQLENGDKIEILLMVN